MSHYRADGMQSLRAAIRETDPQRKLEMVTESLLLHYKELEYLMEHLGPENFSEAGLREIREGK